MEPIALTRASELIHVTDTLERLGESPERMLGKAKMPMWHYCDPDDLVPSHHIYALMDRAALSFGTPTFGLLVGADNSVATLGNFGRMVANALTTYSAFEACCRMVHLHVSGVGFWLTDAGDEVWFCRSQFRGPAVGRWQMEQYILMRMIELVRLGAGPDWRPAKVCLQTGETPHRGLREALDDTKIHIGQKITGIAIPRALLARPLQWCGAAPAHLTEAEEQQLLDTAPAPGFVDTLRQLAGTLLKQGEGAPKIEAVAEIVGLSVRSLQRRLANQGLTHFQIVDQARYRAATRLLEDDDIRMTDIAMDLGYADSAHFSRAFKRWAGVTPREYRSHQHMH